MLRADVVEKIAHESSERQRAAAPQLHRLCDARQRGAAAGLRREGVEHRVVALPQSRKLSVEITFRSPCGGFSITRTMRPASRYGSGYNSTPSTKLKMAVLAPMLIASVRIAVEV